MSKETAKTTELAPVKETDAKRFTNKIMQEFKNQTDADIGLTGYQEKLMQNYFIGLSNALKIAEEARVAKNNYLKDDKYKNDLAYTWNNVDLDVLAIDVKRYIKFDLDILQKNHISAIPFKNNKTNKYEFGFIKGYVGIEYIARKFGMNVPKRVVIELVHKNDLFKPLKRSNINPYDTYVFEIDNPFNRGEIVGGFFYHVYGDPTENRLEFVSVAEILKRRPEKYSVEFWGGEKDIWEDGRKKGTKKVDGWYKEMCYKTLCRMAWDEKYIKIDPLKADVDYVAMQERDLIVSEHIIEAEIEENANQQFLDEVIVPDNETGEVIQPSVMDIGDDLP